MLESFLKGLRLTGLPGKSAGPPAALPRRVAALSGTAGPGCKTALTARGARRPGRGIHGLFDGQIDAVVFSDSDDLDLDLLSLGEMVFHIVHIGIGDLRDVHQTRASAGQ